MIELSFNEHKTQATIELNRVEKSNAMNAAFIAEFSDRLDEVSAVSSVKVCVIRSTAKHFCVGADINWMQASLDLSVEENLKDVALLADLLRNMYQLPMVTIALVHGAVFGGGLGILACCDFVIAAQGASFCFSEVRLGIMPATIAPYISQKISLQTMKQLFFTADVFSAKKAEHYGLVDEVTEQDYLDITLNKWCEKLLPLSKQALIEGKQLLAELHPIDDQLCEQTIARLARMRQSADGQEGLKAFLEKRSPKWSDDV